MSQQLMDDFACFADPKLKPGQGTITIGYFRATCPRPARGGSQSGEALACQCVVVCFEMAVSYAWRASEPRRRSMPGAPVMEVRQPQVTPARGRDMCTLIRTQGKNPTQVALMLQSHIPCRCAARRPASRASALAWQAEPQVMQCRPFADAPGLRAAGGTALRAL